MLRAAEVIQHDDFDVMPPRLLAGEDVGFEQEGRITRAAIVILSYSSLQPVEFQVARVPTVLPYIPGLLSFRETPALIQAWNLLNNKPDLLFVDGHGFSHPRRFGVASHFGLLVNVPTIGVAKKRLCGEFAALDLSADTCQPLKHQGEQIGWVWRSKIRCNPLFISTGHRVAMPTALQWVKKVMAGYRLPEPTRWADAVASKRKAFSRWQESEQIF